MWEINSAFRIPSPLEKILLPAANTAVTCYVKRDDLIHPKIQGNKWRKLKYSFAEAVLQEKNHMVSMGGPWSNHLVALAHACRLFNFSSHAYIRGEFNEADYTESIQECLQLGMELDFLPRKEFDALLHKGHNEFIKENEYFIAMGGASASGIEGCMQIRNEIKEKTDYIMVPVGTGTTCAGLALACKGNEKILAVNIFKKGDALPDLIREKITLYTSDEIVIEEAMQRIQYINDYSFGGFARTTPELIEFRNTLYKETGIDTDLVYTSKLFYAATALVRDGYIPENSHLVILHTGGLQGNRGFQHDIRKSDEN
jgi:1-aminocyclopropane-1-carboxylate deaminase